MKIKREVFAVASGVRDDKGQKGEPEQQPTRTLIESTMETSLSSGGGAAPKAMPLLITHDAPAGEVAIEAGSRCTLCKHFKRKFWRDLVDECDFPTAPLMKRQAINEVRSALLLTRNAQIREAGDAEDGFDVEHVMRQHMGVCSALSDMKKDYVVVHQTGCCPEAATLPDGTTVVIKTAVAPQGYFTPRNEAARKMAEAVYDNVLAQAAGKVVHSS